MKVYIEHKNKTININYSGKLKGLFEKIKINPEEVLPIRNNELILEDEMLDNKDEIKLLSVVSGG